MAVSWIKVILLTLGKPKILLTLHKSKLTLKQVNKILVPLPTLNKSNFRQKSSNFTDFKQDSQSGCLWLPTPHCAAPFTASAMDLRERFLISSIFYLALLPAGFEASLGPAVQPQSYGFMLIIAT